MDFGHFGDNRDQRQPPPTVEGQGNGNNGNGEGNRNNANGGAASEPVFMHTMEHAGVTCDVCSQAIKGFRYKCLECQDFDLCTTCERKGNHPGHVMMRIAFPEQARKAIGRFHGVGSPHHGGHHGGHHGRRHGDGPSFGFGGFPFGGLGGHRDGHRDGHHHKGFSGRGGFHQRPATAGAANNNARDSDDSAPEDPRTANDCPYGLGRKGMKKWAKCAKKMAYQHRRSAEEYARTCGQTATQAAAGAAAGLGAEGGPPNRDASQGQFDFTAAASQIQEFLNAFGIPIDVVELYDSYGNPNQRQAQADASANQQTNGNPTTADNSGGVVNDSTPTGEKNQMSAGGNTPPQQNNLAADLQQLHLSGGLVGAVNVNESLPSAPADNASQAMTMELDSDSAGWTILDNERAPVNANIGNIPQVAILPMPVNNGALAETIPIIPQAVGQEGFAVPKPNGGRLYPGLNPPQLQQLLSGVSQAMNSVVRNIPIVTNPGGPIARSGEVSGPPSVGGEMDVKCTATLNQLLSMGFSNHDQWLSRLVVAKGGNLEAVLNALFPTEAQ